MKNKNYLLTINTKNDFTDERIASFITEKSYFSLEEYSTFINSFTIENKKIREFINFLIFYANGCLCPNMCDAYEPVRELFSPDRIEEPIKWVSQPGSALYLKRVKSNLKYSCVIENQRFAPIWEDKKATKLLKPKVKEPISLGKIRFWFDIKDLLKNQKDIMFIEKMVLELNKIIAITEYSITV